MARTPQTLRSALLITLAVLISFGWLGGGGGASVRAQGTACGPVTAAISAPFSYNGAGTFCWQASDLGAYINSWNLTSLTINGVSFTNLYAVAGSLPPKINGYWYVSYSGQYGWSHFEAAGTGGPTATSAPTTPPTNTPTASIPTNTPTAGIPTNTPPSITPTRTPTAGVPTSTPTQTPQGSTIAINAGGAAAGSFMADAYFTGGNTYNTTTAIDTTQLTGTVPPQAVLQSERYGEFTYTIPNRTPGTAQSVTLYFQESYWTAAGQRTFNVSINGATVLSAFDIFAAAGGTNRAIARTFTATANASGQVVIAFTRGGGPDNPKVNGISVTGTGVVPTSTPTATPTTGTRPSAGCGRTRTLQNGTHTLQSGGLNRTYILNVPSSYSNSRPYRLVFGYPWGGGTAGNVANGGYYGLLPLSNSTAIFIAPQGIDNGWPNPNGRDVTFTDAILSQVLNDLCVDQSRIFATGFSYGGGMSYAVACARPNVFRAIAVIGGGAVSGCSGGTQPVAYLGVHGISDNIAVISAGRAVRDHFIRTNGYPAQAAPEPAVGSRTHICTRYQGGLAAYPVEWCAFDGGHQASPFDGGSGDDGSRSWVPGKTWAFFSQF